MNGAIVALLERIAQAVETPPPQVSQTVIREVIRQPELPEKEGVPKQKGGTLSGTPKAEKSKAKSSADVVRAHLKKHPEDRAKSTRQLAAKLKVSKSTVDRVLKEKA